MKDRPSREFLEKRITELERQVETYKSDAERFRTLFDFFPQGISISDEHGNAVETNPAAKRILGLAREEHEKRTIDGQEWRIIRPDGSPQPPEERAGVIAHKENRTVINQRIGLIKPEGETVWLNVTAIPLPSGNEVIVSCGENTDFEETLNALRCSEEKFRGLFTAMSEGVALHQLVYDKDGKAVDYVLMDVNPAYETILGLKADHIKGRNATSVYNQPEAPFLDRYAKVVTSGRPDVFETLFDPMDKFFRIIAFSPARDQFATVFEDITDRKQLETQLRARTQFLNMLMDAIPIPVFYKNKAGVYMGCNRAFETFLGRPDHEIIGRTAFDISPHDQAEVYQAMDEALLREPDRPQVYETEVRQKYGGIRHVIFHKAVYTSLAGEPEGIVGAILDITDRRQVEEQIRNALREKELLLSEIHHRVKNNLQIFSSLINLQISNLSQPEIIQSLKETQSRIQTMAFIHEGLYASNSMAEINMDVHLEKIARAVSYSYADRLARIRVDVAVGNIFLNLTQAIPVGLVVNELLTNACKHAFSDDFQDGLIRVAMSERSDHLLQLEISDNGVGIPEFFDLKTTPSFGLKLMKSLVDHQLEGTIELVRGQGTTFRVTFARDGGNE